jgi:C-terminal processing protease CtpA/Prc
VIPLVSRQQFDRLIHAKRPNQGTEVAPGVFYVDIGGLTRPALPALLTTLQPAQAIILEMRGYTVDAAYDLLAHFISVPIHSPELRVPILSVNSTSKFDDEGWTLWPASSHLHSRLIVLTDARAVSAGETLLQIIRDNKLATFVGEASAGTNGNVASFTIPGGFEVRFTGMHVSAADGSTIQGHGIVPDTIVHPTLQGIQDGRDEILETAIAIALARSP